MDFIEELRSIKDGKDIKVFPSALLFSAQWSDLIEYRIKANKGREVRWDNPNLSVSWEIEGSPLLTQFFCFRSFRDAMFKIWGDKVWDEPAMIMTDIIGKGSGLGRHQDHCPQIHWNIIGTSRWEITDLNGNRHSVIMNPGDIIFLPSWTYHGVTSLTSPRAGIAYSIKV